MTEQVPASCSAESPAPTESAETSSSKVSRRIPGDIAAYGPLASEDATRTFDRRLPGSHRAALSRIQKGAATRRARGSTQKGRRRTWLARSCPLQTKMKFHRADLAGLRAEDHGTLSAPRQPLGRATTAPAICWNLPSAQDHDRPHHPFTARFAPWSTSPAGESLLFYFAAAHARGRRRGRERLDRLAAQNAQRSVSTNRLGKRRNS